MCNYWYPLANTHGNRTCPTLLDCFVSRTPPLKVRYVSIALPLLTLQECNQGIYHILDGGLNTSHKNNSKCTRPQPPPARDGKLKSLYLRPSTAIYACRACTIYIYGGCPKLLFPQRPLGPSLRQPCAFLARPHSRITFIISVVFHHYSRTCFRMLNI